VSVRVHDVYRPADAPSQLAGLVEIDLGPAAPLQEVREALGRFRGEKPVRLRLRPAPGMQVVLRADGGLLVEPRAELVAALRGIPGVLDVRLHAGPPPKRRENFRRRATPVDLGDGSGLASRGSAGPRPKSRGPTQAPAPRPYPYETA
jgi:hypothetical protein